MSHIFSSSLYGRDSPVFSRLQYEWIYIIRYHIETEMIILKIICEIFIVFICILYICLLMHEVYDTYNDKKY